VSLCGGDLYLDPVGDNLRDGRAVSAGFADDRRGFARDRRLVDRGHAFDHVAIAGNEIAGFHKNNVALLERGRCNRSPAHCTAFQHLCGGLRLGLAQGRCLRLAAPFGHRFR
jgi:hypothetical protein